MKLKPFQKEFERAVEDPRFDIAAISGPRSLGKTFILGRLLARAMTPGDPLFQPGKTVILGAASIEQSRLTYQFTREILEPLGGYRFVDTSTRLGITHISTNTKLRGISSKSTTSFGIVGTSLLCLDEPGALDLLGGQRLWDSLSGALGKVGSPLKVVLAGTLGPNATAPGHWWFDLVETGSTATTFVMKFQGDLKTWDKWSTIRKANPLVSVDPKFRAKLLQERDLARDDSRMAAWYKTFRLNSPCADESEVLLTTEDWLGMLKREVPDSAGLPFLCGVDLGGGRAWSAAVSVDKAGVIRALAVCPGVPSIEIQEQNDHVPKHSYQRLVDAGLLRAAEGLQVPPPQMLWDFIRETWGKPASVISDRFDMKKWQDAVRGACPIEERVWQWSTAADDIRDLRAGFKDGPLVVSPESREMIAGSLAKALVENDRSGNFRLIKRDPSNNSCRDDVAVSMVLAAGGFARANTIPEKKELACIVV